jgi:hypothetical protein
MADGERGKKGKDEGAGLAVHLLLHIFYLLDPVRKGQVYLLKGLTLVEGNLPTPRWPVKRRRTNRL